MTTQVQLTEADFGMLAQFLAREAGLVFDASRRPGLASVIVERLAETGAMNVPEYLALVCRPEGAGERPSIQPLEAAARTNRAAEAP